MRADFVRNEVQRLLREVPFRPFLLVMENGERVLSEHPENIAFDPRTEASGSGSTDFYVIAGRLRLFSTFEVVTSVAAVDQREEGEEAGQESA